MGIREPISQPIQTSISLSVNEFVPGSNRTKVNVEGFIFGFPQTSVGLQLKAADKITLIGKRISAPVDITDGSFSKILDVPENQNAVFLDVFAIDNRLLNEKING